jgi:heme exporter protein D
MQFDSFGEALAMAGHGGYVWSVYGVALLVAACLLLMPVLRSRQTIARQRVKWRREQALKAREGSHASNS